MLKPAENLTCNRSSNHRKPAPGYDRARHGTHNLRRREVIERPSIYQDAISTLPPIFYDEVGSVWVCRGYDESVQILNNHRQFSSARIHLQRASEKSEPDQVSRVAHMLSTQLLFVDPPCHTRLRQALSGQFTPANIRKRSQALQKIVSDALSHLPSDGEINLVQDFAAPLGASLIAYLLKMEGRADEICRWADAYETLLGSLSALPLIRDKEAIPVLDEAVKEFQAIAEKRLANPQDDLISKFATALCDSSEHPGESALDAIEQDLNLVAANALVLAAGGYQTLTHLISGGLLLLRQHPDQLEMLRSDASLIGPAIDEIMRLDGSSQYLGRRATANVDIGGVGILAGETVLVLLAAANLDERKFANPRAFDLTRKQGKHLGFGSGAHYCIGALFAKELASLAINGFLDRYAEYNIVNNGGPLAWGPHYNTRCLSSAHVQVSNRAETRTSSDVAPLPVQEIADAQDNMPASITNLEAYHATTVWNDSDVPLGATRCWHHIFEQKARMCPDATAVECEAVRYTYREIDRRSNALAWLLRSRGVEPESVVVVNMERSAAIIIAILGIAKAGGAFMLTEKTCPPERLRAMLEESRARIVIGDDSTAARLAAQHVSREIITFGTETSASPPITGVGPGSTAFVVFTSGTTGHPKGIANNHEALATLHVAQRRVFGIGPRDRVVQALSLNFDGFIFEVVLALLSGATLIVGEPKRLITGPPLTRFLRDERITAAIMTPTMWSMIPYHPLPDLRIAAFAGERLDGRLAERWMARDRRVLNLYGPAEAGIWVTWHECTEADGDPPIGRPVANKQVYVMDEAGRPLTAGQEGELYIGGTGIGRYIRHNELMAERFIRDPFSSEPERVLYKSGDICVWRQDGVLEYRGRRDRQVKIRGQRVELEEVERVLRAAPGVAVCSVLESNGRLAALVVPEEGEWKEESVRCFLKERLHSGMIPDGFTVVDRLNSSFDGKSSLLLKAPRPAATDDTRDEGPEKSPPSTTGEAANPGTEVPIWTQLDTRERTVVRLTWTVARLFASSLQIPQAQVKFDSDFFALDGDSLAMAELLARLETEFGFAADADSLLDDPTPVGVAKELLKTRNSHERNIDGL
jgi:amino acid adenylation domain-containing protein